MLRAEQAAHRDTRKQKYDSQNRISSVQIILIDLHGSWLVRPTKLLYGDVLPHGRFRKIVHACALELVIFKK